MYGIPSFITSFGQTKDSHSYGEIKSPRPSDWTSSTEESSVEKEAIDIVRIKKYFHTQWAESLAFSWATDSDARSLKY